MRLCLKEVIKRIDLLEKQKSELLSDENQNCTISYGSPLSEDNYRPEYNFDETRNAVKELNAKIRKLRHVLHLANSTVVVPVHNMTLGECIILMAQLNREKDTLQRMSDREPKTRRVSYGGAVEWTENNYDRKECRKALADITTEIMALQVTIDRTNLTHEVVVD